MKLTIALALTSLASLTVAHAAEEVMTAQTCSQIGKPSDPFLQRAGRTIAHLAGAKPDSLSAISDLDRAQLDQAFGAGTVPKNIPHGDAIGYPIAIPGDLGKPLNAAANDLWRGKIFTVDPDGQHATLVNKILFLKNTRSEVSKEKSSYDGKPAIQLNYQNSEMAWARGIVDEIRKVRVPVKGSDGQQVYKDLYLGRANLKGKFVCYFALQFPDQSL